MVIRLIQENNKIVVKRVFTKYTDAYHKKVNNNSSLFAYIDNLPYSQFEAWKLKDDADINNITSDSIVVDTEVELENSKKNWYKRLQKIFARKWLGIQAVIIGRDWGNTVEYIKAQIESYQNLALQAKKILENDPDNANAKAIVARYDESLELQYQVNLVLQQVRGLIETKIREATTYKDSYIDELLSYVEGIKLSKDELNDEKFQEIFQKIQEIIGE